MSWIQKLYDTYENCSSEVGSADKYGKKPTLLPIAHSTQNAQIEVVIDARGEFIGANLLGKDEAVTIIPVTEDSATRSGKNPPPHPLCDKLQYVAGDYAKFAASKKGDEFYGKYIDQLKNWCDSAYANPKVCAVFNYLEKKELIADLIKQGILVTDETTGLLKKDEKLGVGEQSDAFIRFRVEIPGVEESAVWLDQEIYQSYIQHYTSLQEKLDLCYVKGQKMACSEKHPAKVRNTADKAKLISANDKTWFTYRGRFSDKSQVVSVGYETSQKAHNALRWLVDKQGYKNGDQVILAWGTNDQNLPGILEDTPSALLGMEEAPVAWTETDFAKRLASAISGYRCDLDIKSEVIIIGLDAATTGRLSITYYRELNGDDFLHRIEHWHKTCIWKHSYKNIPDGFDEKGKVKFKRITFIGSPSPKDITLAAYGEKVSDKLKKSTIERLLPCIIDGARLPYDIVNAVVNRVSNPVSMENWEWEKGLTISCALIKKHRYDKFKEVWTMALDENQKDRSYIFGRLLAIAQKIEEYALFTAGEKRETNAERLMHQFKLHPYKTWGILTDKLKPYIARLGVKGTRLVELMTLVNANLPYEDFTSNKKLDDSYILGYYCQRQVFVEERNLRVAENQKNKLDKQTEGVREND